MSPLEIALLGGGLTIVVGILILVVRNRGVVNKELSQWQGKEATVKTPLGEVKLARKDDKAEPPQVVPPAYRTEASQSAIEGGTIIGSPIEAKGGGKASQKAEGQGSAIKNSGIHIE